MTQSEAMTDNQKYYRYEERIYSSRVDEFDNPMYGIPRVEVILLVFNVVRHTPKGVWIRSPHFLGDTERFVLSSAKKKYACQTKIEALESFKARKTAQLRILTAQMETVKIALGMVRVVL